MDDKKPEDFLKSLAKEDKSVSPMPATSSKKLPIEEEPKKRNLKPLLILGGVVMLGLIILGVVGIIMFTKKDKKQDNNQDNNNANDDAPELDTIENYKFAEYKLDDPKVEAKVDKYMPKQDLSDVSYTKKTDPKFSDYAAIDNELNANMKKQLAKDLFIIREGQSKEFFSVYEQNRYDFVPNFVTTDAVMHSYHLVFDSVLKNLEENYLSTSLKDLSKEMVQKSQAQYNETEDPELKNAAKRNLAYFAVGAKLIDSKFEVPAVVKTEVDAELKKIAAHGGIAKSNVMGIGFDANDPNIIDEDYSQYIPRGHYTKSDALKRYFNSMMWYGRITFLARDKTTTLSALLITDAMKNDEDTYKLWESVFSPINFFVGKADDLTFYEYSALMKLVAGDKKATELSSDEINKFWEESKKLKTPEINSIPIGDEAITPDREAATKGFRFLGQRFTIDAAIFQKLVYRDVKEKTDGKRKMLPKFLELPMVMGDSTAEEILKSDSDFYSYPNYEDQVSKLKDKVGKFDQGQWTQNLYWSWLYTLNSFAGDTKSGYPSFMLSDKWEKKELNTYAGSWTELKHDTILYSKQIYAEMGAGGDEDKPDDKGYVEPNIDLWIRLEALVKMTKQGLLDRNIIASSEAASDTELCNLIENYKERVFCSLSNMEDMVGELKEISRKELTNEKLTDDENDFIKFIGGRLESLFMSTLDPDSDISSALDDNPVTLVADVATDPNGTVLEEGVGYVNEIYVIVPVEGKLRIAKGGVYSQYEFQWPMSDRLTNEKWRTMLSKNNAPAMQKWQKDLITK